MIPYFDMDFLSIYYKLIAYYQQTAILAFLSVASFLDLSIKK